MFGQKLKLRGAEKKKSDHVFFLFLHVIKDNDTKKSLKQVI